MIYNKNVEDCFFSPRHIGVLDVALPHTKHSCVGKKGQSTVIDLYLQCDEHGFIKNACFKAVGSPYTIASLECLCRKIDGKSLADVPDLSYEVLVKELAIPVQQYPVAVQVVTLYKELVELMNKTFKGKGL
jgi:nitrogen fixation NifU-like protein